MNIKQAKEQIKNAMTAYFTKDELGQYVIPIQRQRPVFLIGAPGIGKTAIMEVNEEFGIKVLTLPVGGFLTLGCLIALMQWALAKSAKKKEAK